MPYRELILRVKAAKAATGITYKEIEDKTRKIGTPVSESSIKRIFAEGSENKMTRNDKTLMPIASVLLAPEIIKDALQPKKETPEESLDIIAMKDDRIDVLKHQMAAKETEYLEQLDREEYYDRVYDQQEREESTEEQDLNLNDFESGFEETPLFENNYEEIEEEILDEAAGGIELPLDENVQEESNTPLKTLLSSIERDELILLGLILLLISDSSQNNTEAIMMLILLLIGGK